jgi:hypothetical protein
MTEAGDGTAPNWKTILSVLHFWPCGVPEEAV